MTMRMGVLYVVSHLIITLTAFLIYGVIYLVKGHADPTLQNILLLIAGYWFGAMGADVVKRRTGQDSQRNAGDGQNV